MKLFLRRQTMTLQLHPTIQKWRERLYDRQNGRQRPVSTIFWIAKDRSKLNPWLDRVALLGFFLSIATLVTGSSNVPILLVMWICQRSLMAVGGPFYAYGWEPQLAELNFHMLFLVPLISLDPLGTTCPPSPIVMFTIRWYLCRIMLGAGLIKIKSRDPKWRWPQLSAMDYFYETQPIPNPLSKYFHWMPHWCHRGEVMVNHFVELIAPLLLLLPSISARRWGGIIQIAFQAVLVTSGNLSFLNWLTAVPAIACLDDGILGPLLFSQSWQEKAVQAASCHGTDTPDLFAVYYLVFSSRSLVSR
ncbi:lipase maturation factor [Nitzschia inconspicua]|uniref:Lipase maturation factor n=1 Tax=Nitzschia inconspicua TaxID=303405 RepID=A0A9K3K631_9STRA|nr:lipase maturation factor [Nitzschia inconspicua]